MKRTALAGAMAAAGLLAFAGPAGAAVYTATYTGLISQVLTNGTYANFFAGGDVAVGAAFTAVFRWDEADAGPSSIDGPPDYSIYDGPMTAAVTVGTLSFVLEAGPGSYLGQQDAPDGQNSVILHNLNRTYGPNLLYEAQFVTYGGADLLSSWDWRVPGSYDLSGADADGIVAFEERGADPFGGCCVGIGRAAVRLTPSSLVVAREGDVSPAPEPGVWALMILGFGVTGAALRRRARAMAA